MRNSAFSVVLFCIILLVSCDPSAHEPSPDQEESISSQSDIDTPAVNRSAPFAAPSYSAQAVDSSRAVRGQVVYAPVYSHIFHISEDRTFDLTATLSIRNVSLSDSIEVRAIDYYNSEGRQLQAYITEPRRLGPLASTYVVVEEDDRSGGVGASFVVEWETLGNALTPPIVEAVMISTSSTQGISFTGNSRVVHEW